MMFHYFGFHYVTCSQPLDVPCACGTFKKPASSIGSVAGSLVCKEKQVNQRYSAWSRRRLSPLKLQLPNPNMGVSIDLAIN